MTKGFFAECRIDPTEILSEPEARYRLFFDANPLPAYVHDCESFRFLEVNQAAIEHYGYSREEFLSMTIHDIRPAEDVPRLVRHLARGLRRTGYTGMWRHRKKDGSLITVEVFASALPGERRANLVFAHDITERLRNEAAAKESSERLNLALKAAKTGVWTWYPTTGRLVWDSYNCEIFGVAPRNFAGTLAEVLPAIHREDRQLITDVMSRASRGDPQLSFQFRVIWPDGSVHHVECHGQAFYDDAGRMMRLTGVSNDITKAKEAEAALRKSEASLSLALSIAQLGTWEQDLATKELSWSAETHRILGFDGADMHSSEQAFLGSVHPEDRDLVSSKLAETASHLKKFDCEYRIVRPDGSIRLVCGLAQPVLNRSAKPLRVVGTSARHHGRAFTC